MKGLKTLEWQIFNWIILPCLSFGLFYLVHYRHIRSLLVEQIYMWAVTFTTNNQSSNLCHSISTGICFLFALFSISRTCLDFLFSKSRLGDPDIFWDGSKWGPFRAAKINKTFINQNKDLKLFVTSAFIHVPCYW